MLAVLKKAREKIEKGWTQLAYARRPDGTVVHSNHGDANCWCLSGAIDCAYKELELDDRSTLSSGAYRAVYDTIVQENHVDTIAEWNDRPGRTVEQVLAVLDRTISDLEPKE